ncbi:MAG: hypothetical protein JNL67_01775 [Planctomycetaceae bacterium]|nr:hypothetical protein [Planctomycetaceae bacterium]
MARKPRKVTIDPKVVQVVHIWNRCIRAMQLCGKDPLTGVDREHRRSWSRDRLEHLAMVYAIEILTYAIMHNHTHLVVRSRPDIASRWSPDEVARRWLMITPKRDRSGKIIEPSAKRIQAIVNNPELIDKIRVQLSDVSWMMRSYAQHIASRANYEDQKKGHFWEERFKSHVLLDQASILKCMLYVDLNPIRANIARSIEQSDFTGAKDRLDDLRIHIATQANNRIVLQLESGSEMARWERMDHSCSGWLSPIEIDAHVRESACESDGMQNESPPKPRRVSQRGAVRISLTKYLLLLDLAGRQQRVGGSGFIPDDALPILQQLGLEPTGFFESIWMFGQRFKSTKRRRFSEPLGMRECDNPAYVAS